MGSFYIGYVCTQIPGGRLSERFGGKYVLAFTQAVTALLTILTPVTVTMGGAAALIQLQIMLGVLQGGLFPAVFTVIATWVPKSERAFSSSIIYNGLLVRLYFG